MHPFRQVTLATAVSVAAMLLAGASQASPALAGTVAPNLAVDGLTATWRANSDAGSTGSPQPLPTTTAHCGIWSGADGTQVVRLNDGENLWTFGDTFIGPAVTRQDFFNNSFIHNSMVRQSGSTFTTITGGTGCPGTTTGAKAPVVPSVSGQADWPGSNIVYGSNLVKFYYSDALDANLTQVAPQAVEFSQTQLESGNTVGPITSTPLSGCLANPIMWGAATVTATTSGTTYTYIYGRNSAASGGNLYLARTSGDPFVQSMWQYYTGGTTFQSAPSSGCGSLALATLGSLEVPQEFSVTLLNSHFWLVDQDPLTGGTFPGWATAHEALNPWSFTGSATDAVSLFEPGITQFSGIDDGYPSAWTYGAKLLDPAAVTPSTAGDVVVAYNVNIAGTVADPGCISLIDYDANVYRPRFIDVPMADLVTGLPGGTPARSAAAPAAAPPSGSAVHPAGDGVRVPVSLPGSVMPSQLRTLGAAQLRNLQAAVPSPQTGSSWTYNPDAVPQGNSYWKTTCPSSYAKVTSSVTIQANSDGSLELSWPNQGADVWYWVYWQDQTANPGTWTRLEFWAEGPNADGWEPSVGLLPASDTTTIREHFIPTTGKNGDKYIFWVQAFAAGSSATSPDSAASPTSAVKAGVAAPTGLDATVDTGHVGVSLDWTAIGPWEGESIGYYVYYKLSTASTWTKIGEFINANADVTPLTAGKLYDFKVTAVNNLGEGPASTTITATP